MPLYQRLIDKKSSYAGVQQAWARGSVDSLN